MTECKITDTAITLWGDKDEYEGLGTLDLLPELLEASGLVGKGFENLTDRVALCSDCLIGITDENGEILEVYREIDSWVLPPDILLTQGWTFWKVN